MLFCSIVATNFLPHARVLADSLRRHHPGSQLELFVVDAADEPLPGDEPFRQIGLKGMLLSPEEFHRQVTMYGPQPLCSSLNARVLMGALERSDGPVAFVDADTLALGPLDDVFELAARHTIVVTPHATIPLPFEPGGIGPEQAFIRAGIFNAGFVAVSRAATDFLRWWDERSSRDSVWELDRGIHAAQGWLSLVPALFDNCVLRDRGVNLTGHGIGDDDVDWRDAEPWIAGTRLRLFHFAGGFDPHSGELGGARAPESWPAMSERPGLARLCAEYARLLLEAGYEEASATTWRFGALADGTPIDWAMRRAYREALVAAEAGSGDAEPPNPFAHGDRAFTDWLGEPRWPGSGVSRYLAAVRGERADLVAAFPDVPGEDDPGFLAWAAGKYPDGRLPEGLPTAAVAS